MSETSAVVRPILDALEAAGVACHRIHCGRVKVRGGWMHLNPEGLPDIGGHMSTIGGRAVAFYIEAKGTHGNACKCASCKAQRERRATYEKDGALYIFARSPSEALIALGLARAGGAAAEREAPKNG